MEHINIDTKTITLGQFLKFSGIVGTGGMVKMILTNHTVLVNNEKETRRGRRLASGDIIEIEGIGTYKVQSNAH